MTRSVHDAVAGDTAVQVAEYVCGLLGPEEHAQIHVLLSRDDGALALALTWEERLLALVDALPRSQPDAALRERLQHTLGIAPPPAVQPPPQLQLLRKRSVEPSPRQAAGQAAMHARQEQEPDTTARHAPTPGATASITPASATPASATPASATPASATPMSARPASIAPAAGAKAPTTAPKTPVSTVTAPAATASTTTASATSASPRATAETPAPAAQAAATPATARSASAAAAPSRKMEAASGSGEHTGKRDPQRRLTRKLWLWRLVSLCAVAAAVAGFMLPGEPPPPPVQIVKVAPTHAAILQAPGSTSTPGWTATLDPQGNLTMRPLVHTEVPVGSQVMLWTRSRTIPEPRPLGRIDPNRPVQVPAAQLGALAQDQLLEITLERDEDAAQGTANGPILFIGQMTVFGSEAAPADPAATAAASSGVVTQRTQP